MGTSSAVFAGAWHPEGNVVAAGNQVGIMAIARFSCQQIEQVIHELVTWMLL